MDLPILICPFCGEEFTKRHAGSTQKYCSPKCTRKADDERKRCARKKVTRQKRNNIPEEGLNRKLQSGKPYADIQKAESIEMYARVKV